MNCNQCAFIIQKGVRCSNKANCSDTTNIILKLILCKLHFNKINSWIEQSTSTGIFQSKDEAFEKVTKIIIDNIHSNVYTLEYLRILFEMGQEESSYTESEQEQSEEYPSEQNINIYYPKLVNPINFPSYKNNSCTLDSITVSLFGTPTGFYEWYKTKALKIANEINVKKAGRKLSECPPKFRKEIIDALLLIIDSLHTIYQPNRSKKTAKCFSLRQKFKNCVLRESDTIRGRIGLPIDPYLIFTNKENFFAGTDLTSVMGYYFLLADIHFKLFANISHARILQYPAKSPYIGWIDTTSFALALNFQENTRTTINLEYILKLGDAFTTWINKVKGIVIISIELLREMNSSLQDTQKTFAQISIPDRIENKTLVAVMCRIGSGKAKSSGGAHFVAFVKLLIPTKKGKENLEWYFYDDMYGIEKIPKGKSWRNFVPKKGMAKTPSTYFSGETHSYFYIFGNV